MCLCAANDTITGVKTRLESGSTMLSSASSLLTELKQTQGNSTNTIDGILSTLLGVLNGGGQSSSASVPSLFSTTDVSSTYFTSLHTVREAVQQKKSMKT